MTQRLGAVAGRQFGVISQEQLRGLGLSRDDVRGRLRSGLLIPWLPRVFAVGHLRVPSQGHLIAALLSCGPSSFLSHRTAAALWGLRALNLRRLDVTVPGAKAPIRRALLMHRTGDGLRKGDVAMRNGLRLSTPTRLLIELAPSETLPELDRLITQAVRKRVLDLEAIDEALRRHAQRPGVARLRQALRGYQPRQDRKSALEVAFDELIAGTEIPVPEKNVMVDGWELDCYWPEHNLIVELDGRNYHTAVRDMEKDRVKDTHFLLKGIGTMRITDLRFELEPAKIKAELLQLTT